MSIFGTSLSLFGTRVSILYKLIFLGNFFFIIYILKLIYIMYIYVYIYIYIDCILDMFRLHRVYI